MSINHDIQFFICDDINIVLYEAKHLLQSMVYWNELCDLWILHHSILEMMIMITESRILIL